MNRRHFLTLTASSVALTGAGALPAMAAGPDTANALVRQVSDEVLAMARSAGSTASMEAGFRSLMDRYADMRRIAGIALGRYSRSMTDAQKTRYIEAFKNFVAKTYSSRFNEYSGETIDIGRTQQDGQNFLVSTQVKRGGQPPLAVDWLISDESGSPRVIDFIIEGLSMALSQRGEFVSMIDANGGNIDTFIANLESRARS